MEYYIGDQRWEGEKEPSKNEMRGMYIFRDKQSAKSFFNKGVKMKWFFPKIRKGLRLLKSLKQLYETSNVVLTKLETVLAALKSTAECTSLKEYLISFSCALEILKKQIRDLS